MTTLSVGLMQQAAQPTKEAYYNATETHIERLAELGTQLIVLQELHCTPYFCQTIDQQFFDWAEPLEGPTTQWLLNLSKRLGVVIVGSIFEKRMAGVYHNTAVVADNGGFAGHYRKMHIPDDPGFYEKYYFTPGDTQAGFTPINTSIGKLGVLVCWDQWYPEAARLMALAGAELLIYPTAIGWNPNDDQEEKQRQLDAWITIQRAHAIANHLPVIAVNRVGHEGDPSNQTAGIDFWGNSFICGAQGEFLKHANTNATLLYAEIKRDNTTAQRQIWPFFRDRRIDAYSGLTQRVLDKR